VQGDYIVPLPTHSWTDAEKEALRQVLEEKDDLINELQDALDGMRGIAKGRMERVKQLEAQLAAPRWEPVNPIGMVNDEYDDCDIKLCYRLVQPTQAQDE
jgi:hypothetical protein